MKTMQAMKWMLVVAIAIMLIVPSQSANAWERGGHSGSGYGRGPGPSHGGYQ